jgi:hypothetical protein
MVLSIPVPRGAQKAVSGPWLLRIAALSRVKPCIVSTTAFQFMNSKKRRRANAYSGPSVSMRLTSLASGWNDISTAITDYSTSALHQDAHDTLPSMAGDNIFPSERERNEHPSPSDIPKGETQVLQLHLQAPKPDSGTCSSSSWLAFAVVMSGR